MKNLAQYLLARRLLNLEGEAPVPPAPPVVDPATPPPAPPVVDPAVPPAPAAPPVPPAPTPEEKAAADAAAATAAAEKTAAIKSALTLPDNSVFTAEALERTAAIASELGLSPEQAKKVLDYGHQEAAAVKQSVIESFATGGSEWTKHNGAMQAAALADPDIGAGSSAKLVASAEKAKRGMAALFGDQTAAVEKYLTDAGLASTPVLVKAFMRAADKMGEPAFHTGNPTPKNAGKRDADVLFGDTPAAPPAQT